ncbi:MAG: hypothetical protein SW833_08760 [Cyanobacteriota bacterium]|nr:hypothetical protein [Cyanobacteriota bacterium]
MENLNQARAIQLFAWTASTALVLTSGSLVAEKARAASIIQPETDGPTRQILFSSPTGQTFTAEDSAIRSIGFDVRDFNPTFAPNDFDLTVSLFRGVGVTGQLVGSSVFTDLTTGFSGFVDFDFSTVTLEVGEIYTAILEDDTVRWALKSNQHSFAVPGGSPIPGAGPD